METLKEKLNQQPNTFLLWTMEESPTLTDNYFLMSGTPKRNFNSIHSNKVYAMGKKTQGELHRHFQKAVG